MVTFMSTNQIPAAGRWLPPPPPPPLHRLPPPPDAPLTGGRDQKPPSPASGEFPPATGRRRQRRRIKQRPPECFHRSWAPTSPRGSGGGRHLTMWPAPTLPASRASPVSPPSAGPSGVDAARTDTPETESHVKVRWVLKRLFWDIQLFKK